MQGLRSDLVKLRCPKWQSEGVSANKKDEVLLDIIHSRCNNCGYKWDDAVD